ncbi:Roundabout -like protein 2like, partial [Caligus rogercresseyi]
VLLQASRNHISSPELDCDSRTAPNLRMPGDCSPDPKISWFKDGSRLESSPDRMVLPDGSLFFLRVVHSKKESDAGDYHCQAENSAGSIKSHSASLEIACKSNTCTVDWL